MNYLLYCTFYLIQNMIPLPRTNKPELLSELPSDPASQHWALEKFYFIHVFSLSPPDDEMKPSSTSFTWLFQHSNCLHYKSLITAGSCRFTLFKLLLPSPCALGKYLSDVSSSAPGDVTGLIGLSNLKFQFGFFFFFRLFTLYYSNECIQKTCLEQWGKKVCEQSPIVQDVPLKKITGL